MRKKVLIGCEESQAVCIEMRKAGHDAFSCDILPCSGNHPEWHIQEDILKILNQGWDAMICFPPCTHLAVSGAAWFEQKRKDGRQQEGVAFFMQMVEAPIKYIAVENSIGIMSSIYKKPTQIIQPYYFGDTAQKTTCLWLKNLPALRHVKRENLFYKNVTHVDKGTFYQWIDGKTGKIKRQPEWYAKAFLEGKEEDRAKTRSKTFPGIAKAMGEQWGAFLHKI